MPSLQEELDYFAARKDALLQTNKGQYALIKGSELVGTFTTFEEAYEKGIQTFGNVAFLIKLIVDKEPVEQIPALTYGLISASI